jgi:glutathione synthase/RimK-type ligase-like ATP-grasp enzyme
MLSQDMAREHFDVDHDFIAHLNGECLDWAGMDAQALQDGLKAQGEEWYGLVSERCPHLFAAAPVFISDQQLQQMQQVIAAAEQALGVSEKEAPLGVFYGYDFHLNEQGAHLIEINTNAGGAFLNALLIDSQRAAHLYGEAVGEPDPAQAFIAMFRDEWRLVHGDAPLQTVAIVDEQPESQYLYPEFLLAQKMFERAGITAFIADPAQLEAREDGLYRDGRRIDLVYNRLTDFDLSRHAHLREAWGRKQVVLTPGPAHHAKYADKRKLAWLTDAAALRAAGVAEEAIMALQQGIPHTEIVRADDAEHWWSIRKEWFFKPVSGYGSKGAYRGDKMTKRVFEAVMQADYIAQRLAVPGERKVCLGEESVLLKYDVRCYVYAGRIQMVAARLYQGQTTNFRTAGGGFALVRVIS